MIQLFKMHSHLLKNGYFASAVCAPACALDAPRFRICATANQTPEIIDDIIKAMVNAREECQESERVLEFFQ